MLSYCMNCRKNTGSKNSKDARKKKRKDVFIKVSSM